MKRGFSAWLDTLRVAATLVVVVSHWAYERFTRGDYQWIRDLNFGSDAVILFFVTSGLVIAYAAERDQTVQRYAFNRLTRLLSVLAPALLLTYVFDQMGYAHRPASYPDAFYTPLSLTELLFRGLTMTNEWAFLPSLRLGTNGPLWSLSYEAAYYVLLGIAVFSAGMRRIVLLVILVILIGPRILLLMPSWVMGALIWRYLRSGKAAMIRRHIALGLAIVPPIVYGLCLAIGLPLMLRGLTENLMAPYSISHILRFSDEFLWNAMIGAMVGLHMIGMARLLSEQDRGFGWLRWCAGASFSIYVTHYPSLHLLDAYLPLGMQGRDAVLLVGSISVGVIFASLFERRIGALRQTLLRLMGREQITSI